MVQGSRNAGSVVSEKRLKGKQNGSRFEAVGQCRTHTHFMLHRSQVHANCGTLVESFMLPGRAWQTADFGPKTALKIVDKVRDAIKSGKVKTSDDLRAQLKVGLALV